MNTLLTLQSSTNQNQTSDIAIEEISDLQSLIDDLRDDDIFLASDAHTDTGSLS
jgi:hypothetical protein